MIPCGNEVVAALPGAGFPEAGGSFIYPKETATLFLSFYGPRTQTLAYQQGRSCHPYLGY